MADSFTIDEIAAGPDLAAQNALHQAASSIEEAVHAPYDVPLLNALDDAATSLHWALDDLALVGNEDQLAAATALSATLDAIVAAGIPDGTALPTFQLQLIPLQSQILEVATVPAAQWFDAENQAYDSGMVAFWAILGGALFIGGCAGYIDWKQSHGGYHRGAPGVARPLVTYRYPRP